MREDPPLGYQGSEYGRGGYADIGLDDAKHMSSYARGSATGISDGGRDFRRSSPSPPSTVGAAGQFLLETVKNLKGERSVHGLNSTHCLLPDPQAPGNGFGGMAPCHNESQRASSPAPASYNRYAAPPAHAPPSPNARASSSYTPPCNSGLAPPGSMPPGSRVQGPAGSMPPGARNVPPPALMSGDIGPQPRPGSIGPRTRPGSMHAPPGYMPPGAMGGPPPPLMSGDLKYCSGSCSPWPPMAPGSDAMHSAGAAPGGHFPHPQGHDRDFSRQFGPDAFGNAPRSHWPVASGQPPVSHLGQAGQYCQTSVAQPMAHTPMAPRYGTDAPYAADASMFPGRGDVNGMSKGPAGHSLPVPVARLPTPAKAPGGPPARHAAGCDTTERSMANGFKDSADFIDAGAESEAEFLTSRSLPPPRQKKGTRTHRRRDEASCIPCLIMC